jgi:hypothetical protein
MRNLTIRLSEEEYDVIERAAKAASRSRNAEIHYRLFPPSADAAEQALRAVVADREARMPTPRPATQEKPAEQPSRRLLRPLPADQRPFRGPDPKVKGKRKA